MLGLLDLLRAVKGTLTLTLRRVHPVVGVVAIALLWTGALGAMFTLTRDAPSREPQHAAASSDYESSDDGSSTSTSDHEGNGNGDDDADWSQTAESTRTPVSPDEADGTTPSTVSGPGGELGAPSGTTASTRPRTGTPDPSWATSSTTSTTSAPPGATTTTTAPPGNGGVLGGLLDLLGLGG